MPSTLNAVGRLMQAPMSAASSITAPASTASCRPRGRPPDCGGDALRRFYEALAQARGALQRRLKAKAARSAVHWASSTRASRPLDLQAGGSLAQDLRELYAYVSVRLVQANLNNDEAASRNAVA